MTIIIPNLGAPLTVNGKVADPWNDFFSQFTTSPSAVLVLSVGTGVPYTAKEPGNIVLSGGAVSAVTLQRGSVSVALPSTLKIIPVEIKDRVIVTFTGGTAIQFWPRY